MDNQLDADRIRDLLHDLASRLCSKDLQADLFVVGGAAMVLAYNRTGLTHDIDGVFAPASDVREVISDMARELELSSDWLNDGVKGFLPSVDPDAKVLLDVEGLRVTIASPRYLFCLKAVAARVDRDTEDLELLWPLCGFVDVDEAIGHVESTMPKAMLTPKTPFLLRELFA